MKMCISLSLLFSLFLLIHTTNGFDITQILNKYPDFSTFNSYLTQTSLAAAINARQAITVLVVDNANLAPLSRKSLDITKNILSVHVILDYYDVPKLQQLSSSSSLLTTLFQASGIALGQQGFLNVSQSSTGSITLASAMPGSTQGASLVKLVVSEPYNVSIIQVSNAILPQGIDGTKTSSPPTTPPSVTQPPPPPPPPATASAPVKSSLAPPPSTVPPTPSQAKAPTSSQAKAPTTSSPPTKAQAQAPTNAATPSASPGSAPAPAAMAPGTLANDAPTFLDSTPAESADDKPKFKSAATAGETGLALVCTMALSTLYLGSRI